MSFLPRRGPPLRLLYYFGQTTKRMQQASTLINALHATRPQVKQLARTVDLTVASCPAPPVFTPQRAFSTPEYIRADPPRPSQHPL